MFLDCDFSSILRNICLCMCIFRTPTEGENCYNPDVVLVENNGIKPHDIKRAMEIARMYQKEFIKAWEEYHGE